MFVTQLDYQLFEVINGLAGRFPWMDAIMAFIAKDMEYLFYIAILIYWFTRIEANRRMVTQALLSACAAFGVSILLSHLFYRDRPFVVHRVVQLISHPINASFPSDHAIGAFVIATSIWLCRRRDGYIWLAIAAVIAFSRIWTGVHYPLDVISGALIGMGAAIGVHTLFKRSSRVRHWFQWSIGRYEELEDRIWPKLIK